MSDHDSVDSRLAALFGGIDTRADFNSRLLDRLHREIAQDAERAREALRLEQLRHWVAKQELQSWRSWKRALGRFVTLETLGMGVLAALTVTSTWSPEQIRQSMPVAITALGLLLAIAPIVFKKQ